MSLRPFACVPLLAVLCITAGAQGFVQATVGPQEAPLGCPIQITFSNDGPFGGSGTPCPYEVFDEDLELVYTPSCAEVPIFMGPWGWITASWNQRDQSGQQVPPGRYFVRTDFDVGPSTMHEITIGSVEAGVVLLGNATIFETITGESRRFSLCSPNDPGGTYLLLASLSSTTGLATCGGVLPLDPDPLFALSLTPNAVFQGSVGTLNGQGSSTAPVFDLPENPNLVGLSMVAAFAVLDFQGPCPVKRVSNAHPMTILG